MCVQHCHMFYDRNEFIKCPLKFEAVENFNFFYIFKNMLLFFENVEKKKKLSSAAVVIGL